MRRGLRQATSALLVAAVFVTVAAPAVAAPREESARPASLASLPAFGELVAWVGQWLHPLAPESVSAASGRGMDPNGTSTTNESGNDPEDSVTPQSGRGMDPDG